MKFISSLNLKKSLKDKISKVKKAAKSAKTFKINKAEKEKDTDEEVTLGTKIKVIAAVLVVGLATYVAYWVQEPTENMKLDLFNSPDGTIEESIDTEDAELVEEVATFAASDDEAFPTLAEVSLIDFTFTPANITVEAGTTVVWTNMDSVAHTVTSDIFSSGSMEAGESYNFSFEEEGVYEYTCSFHPQMIGKVIVTASEEPVVKASVSEDIAEEYFSSLDDTDSSISPDLLAVDGTFAAVEEDIPSPGIITFDADELLADDAALHEAARVADASIQETDELATTGPEDFIYAGIFITILYFNRRKIVSALR